MLVYLGTPPQELRPSSQIVVEGMHTALDAVRSGGPCEEVEAAWRRILVREGFE